MVIKFSFFLLFIMDNKVFFGKDDDIEYEWFIEKENDVIFLLLFFLCELWVVYLSEIYWGVLVLCLFFVIVVFFFYLLW